MVQTCSTYGCLRKDQENFDFDFDELFKQFESDIWDDAFGGSKDAKRNHFHSHFSSHFESHSKHFQGGFDSGMGGDFFHVSYSVLTSTEVLPPTSNKSFSDMKYHIPIYFCEVVKLKSMNRKVVVTQNG